jgi:hypothetical protein
MRWTAAGTLAVWVACWVGCADSPPPPVPVAEPELGQPGKDVVWVPSPDVLVEKMLDLAQLTPTDTLIDLGSGDGRTVIAAARRGARAKGIEFNPDLVAFATERARQAGLADRATFETADLFTTDLGQATVITLFLSSEINLKLRPRLLELPPGTRIVGNTFMMADWEPDQSETAGDCRSWCEAHLWIVPARVEGDWMLDGRPLHLAQRFQRISGTLGGASLESGRIRGSSITLTVRGQHFTGRVDGATMSGTTDDGRSWSATRR